MKMDFHEIAWTDKEWLRKAFWEDGRQACEFTFANNYLWREVYQVQVASCCGCAVLRYTTDGVSCYAFPCGHGDKKAALESVILYADERGQKPELTGLTRCEAELLEKWFPHQFEISTNRDDYDYIYTTEALTKLAGKKYHGKRNHIARFKDTDWAYEEITEQNAGECRGMLLEWKGSRADKWSEMMEAEFGVVMEALEYFGRLDLEGGLIRQSGRIVAFCLGEPLNEDTYVVHFEKAFPEIQGAYPIINQQFVEHVCQAYQYVNREEDAGEEGLRKAKLSYRPEILLEKFRAALI